MHAEKLVAVRSQVPSVEWPLQLNLPQQEFHLQFQTPAIQIPVHFHPQQPRYQRVLQGMIPLFRAPFQGHPSQIQFQIHQ